MDIWGVSFRIQITGFDMPRQLVQKYGAISSMPLSPLLKKSTLWDVSQVDRNRRKRTHMYRTRSVVVIGVLVLVSTMLFVHWSLLAPCGLETYLLKGKPE